LLLKVICNQFLHKWSLSSLQIQPYMRETRLPVPDQYSDVFNDTSVHTFPQDKLATVPCAVWQDITLPVYTPDEAEIILQENTWDVFCMTLTQIKCSMNIFLTSYSFSYFESINNGGQQNHSRHCYRWGA